MSKPKKTIKAAIPPPKKPDPLDPALVPAWQILLKQAGKIESQIEDRLDYILKTIYSTFGQTLDHWYFDGAEEGQLGDLARHFEAESIYGLIMSPPLEANPVILLKSGTEWGFDDSVPTRWMFEPFEEELANGKLLYAQKQVEEAAKKKLKKEQKDEKRRQVLDKLSPAERKLLGLK